MTANDVVEESLNTPWSWLKTISRDLYNLDEAPLLGYSPSFPLQEFAANFAASLELANCTIENGKFDWRAQDMLTQGISGPHFWTEIAITGIDSTCFLLASQADIAALMNLMLGVSIHTDENQQEEFLSSFHRFLTVQALQVINNLDFDKRLSFRAHSFSSKANEAMLCQEIQFSVGKELFQFRLCMPVSFQKAWRTFYQTPQQTLPPTKERLEQVFVTLHFEAARTQLSLNQLLEIRPGDFVVCDQTLYNPLTEQSHLVATVQNKPFFLAEHSDGSLKILEIPLHREVYQSMADKVNQPTAPTDANQNDHLEDHSLQAPSDDDASPFDDEEDDENPFEDDEDEDEDFDFEESEVPPITQKPAAAVKAAEKPKPEPTFSKDLTANDIPMTLVVEVGQVGITAQKLLELQPGNMIDLEIAPNSGVDLVINGRIIGKGELLQIGETIGVRILQIGT